MTDPYTAEEPGKALISAGSDIAGSAAGAAVGLLFGGPAGVVVGAALGTVATQSIRRVADEVSRRVLGPRERVRAGAAVAFGAERLQELLELGATIRDDGFFTETPTGRNAALETIEGVILAARRSFEERKVRHLGYMIANIAIHPEIDSSLAAQLLLRAEALTWRQYVLLAAVGRADEHPLPSGTIDTHAVDWETWGAKFEFMSLYEAHYFTAPEKRTARGDLPLFNTEMSEQRLGSQGRLIHALLDLDEISDDEIGQVHRLLAVDALESRVTEAGGQERESRSIEST